MPYTYVYTYNERPALGTIGIVLVSMAGLTVVVTLLSIWVCFRMASKRKRAAAAETEQQNTLMAQTQSAYSYPHIQQVGAGNEYPDKDIGMSVSQQNGQQGHLGYPSQQI